jgi:hypothetical protein
LVGVVAQLEGDLAAMRQLGALRANRMATNALALAGQGDYAAPVEGLEEAMALAEQIGMSG